MDEGVDFETFGGGGSETGAREGVEVTLGVDPRTEPVVDVGFLAMVM